MANKKTSDSINLFLPDGKLLPVGKGRSLIEISAAVSEYYPAPIVAAMVDHKVVELTEPLAEGSELRFLDLTSMEGMRIYRRSLTFLLIEAIKELYPEAIITVVHFLGNGLYCEIKKNGPLDAAAAAQIEARMRQLIREDRPFKRRRVSLAEAARVFSSQGDEDKVKLLSYWPGEHVDLYSIGSREDYLYGSLVPRTGVLEHFALNDYQGGLVLRMPEEKNPFTVPPFMERKQLFGIFHEADRWGTILGFDPVGAMNSLIEGGKGPEIVRVAEALHEKKIAQIADLICERREEIRVILVAGPSSSGKTTFAQRLRVQLLVNGLRPVPISIDDYFLDREATPLDEFNEPDFESLKAIDLSLFNEHLVRLIAGEEVEIPSFNFTTGKREFGGRRIKLGPDQPLIIEGIHGLNEELTRAIPRRRKFKIYISALTALNMDRYTRIRTSDTRLLRRIVRDAQFRGNAPLESIRRWPAVRRGEEKNIFCLQEEADIMFNSALVYELAVLKKYAEPLLKKIDRTRPEYVEAQRLLHLLSFFVPLDPNEVPTNSILREFIGKSCFFG